MTATSHNTAIPAAAIVQNSRFGTLRRWWIERTLPAHDSDLSPAEWRELEQRYIDAGGDPEELGRIIERVVLDD